MNQDFIIFDQRELSSPALSSPDATVWSDDDFRNVRPLGASFSAASSAVSSVTAGKMALAPAVGVLGDSADWEFCGCS